MTPFLLLYYLLLVVWLPLLWPLLRLKGGARIWLFVVVAAGLVAVLYEIRMTFWTTNAIRVDILLLSLVLVVLYGSAAVVLLRARWRKAAALLGFALVLIGGGMVYEWVLLGQESQRLRETFQAGNRLLFEARFRDRDTYERRFGPFAGASGAYPSGHWQAQGETYFTRLIVNAAGQAWLFFRCDEDTECPYAVQGAQLQSEGGAGERAWRATLKPRVGMPFDLRIAQAAPRRLTLETDKQSALFSKAPPPIDPAPAERALVYLGAFAAVACRGQHADVRQLWLWQEGPRLYAVGIFATLLAGRRDDFGHPLVLGEGTRVGDAWRFEGERNGRSWQASVDLQGPQPRLTLEQEGRDPEPILLDGEPVYRDEVIALAPPTSKEDWDHWFAIVLTGHFASGEVPAC